MIPVAELLCKNTELVQGSELLPRFLGLDKGNFAIQVGHIKQEDQAEQKLWGTRSGVYSLSWFDDDS
jgi:hypothetical protein